MVSSRAKLVVAGEVGVQGVASTQQLAAEYHVTAIPMVMLIKNGSSVNKFTGVKDEDTVAEFIADALKE